VGRIRPVLSGPGFLTGQTPYSPPPATDPLDPRTHHVEDLAPLEARTRRLSPPPSPLASPSPGLTPSAAYRNPSEATSDTSETPIDYL
jgi:hypothetical protein